MTTTIDKNELLMDTGQMKPSVVLRERATLHTAVADSMKVGGTCEAAERQQHRIAASMLEKHAKEYEEVGL